MASSLKSLPIIAWWFSVPVLTLGAETADFRWHFDSHERWCLELDERDLCLPKSMEAQTAEPHRVSFELTKPDGSPEITVIAASSSAHPFDEENLRGLPFEAVGDSVINGIETTKFRVDQLVYLKLQLTPAKHMTIIGTDADRIDRLASNLTAQWHVRTSEYSSEGACARFFVAGCITESPEAIALIEEIDNL